MDQPVPRQLRPLTTCHHLVVTTRSLEDLDDATFDSTDARIVDGSVTLHWDVGG